MTKGNTTWTYTYDANGMRTERSPGDAQGTYTYVYNGSQLSQMIYEGYTYSFTYDAAGTPLTFSEGNNVYYYETNLQGDVIGIEDSSGQQVVTYAYDAWGNVQILQGNQIAVINPLTYRGYVYDWETGLYYLQSRYYNPEWGRFINADGYNATGQGFVGNNMFAYCNNNAIMLIDTNGKMSYAIDTNNDGIDDCFVYNYQYSYVHHIRGRSHLIRINGSVYIYTNLPKAMFDVMEPPEGFNSAVDLMVLDLTSSSDNPTLYARQAHKVKARVRGKMIACMQEYDEEFQTPWERTDQSLKVEWNAHDMFAPYDTSAQNIDFDNKEEGKGYKYYISKAYCRFYDKIQPILPRIPGGVLR